MAIRAGMSVAEAILQLTRGFEKVMGRKPDGLEKIKIQQEAVQRLKNLEKVVDMQGNVIDTSKGIVGGKQIQENKEFGKALREYLMRTDNPYSDLVKETKKGPKTLEQRRKEAEEALKNKNVTPIKDPEDMAQGGRAGFKTGLGKRFLELFKPKPKPKFDERRFREGPIDLDFLKNVDKKDIEKFIRTRDTKGPGSYGMYDNFADMPAGLKAAELIKRFVDRKTGRINYEDAGIFLGKKLKGNESIDELIQILNRQEMRADGGRAGFNNGGAPSIKLDAQGSRTGRQQIKGAPEGITRDEETFNAIISADIPVSEKIDLLSKLQYGKSRSRIEAGGQEIFMDEGGFKSRDIGLGFNKEAMLKGSDREGIGGTLMYNLETGEPEFNIGFKKKFAGGGRANFDKGGMSRRQFMKIMGGIASLPFIGKFFKGAKPAAKVAEVATKTPVSKPPEYFFDLAAKIKILGKESSTARRERMIEVDYKNYTLEEDLVTGDITIIKRKGDPDFEYQEEVMTLKKGQADETTKGKTPPDEYEEVTVRPEPDTGRLKEVEDGIEPESIQEIVEEVGQGGGNLDQRTLEEIARGRLASGGRASFSKGGIRTYLKNLLNFLAEKEGLKGSDQLRALNPKSFPRKIRTRMTAKQLKDVEANRAEYLQGLLDMLEADKKNMAKMKGTADQVFKESMREAMATGDAEKIDLLKKAGRDLIRAQQERGIPYLKILRQFEDTNIDDTIAEGQKMLKDFQIKKGLRKLNASGGVAMMLGE